jgi:acyl-CoA thioester hydrolase
MPKIFKHEFAVTDDVIDGNGHVNNVAYVQWMQDIAIMHSDAQGCDAVKYAELSSSWIIRSHHIEYSQPAFAGDKIEAFTWVADIKRTSSLRKTRFIGLKDGVVLARAETRWVYVDRSTGKPKLIDSYVRNAFIIVPPDQEP